MKDSLRKHLVTKKHKLKIAKYAECMNCVNCNFKSLCVIVQIILLHVY